MARFDVKVKGLKEVERLLGDKGRKAVIREIEDEIKTTAERIESLAKQKAPVDMGGLRASIQSEGDGLIWKVAANEEYSGYVEFGTKTKVSVPPEMQEEAEKFKSGRTSEVSFRAAIEGWVRRKGLPPEAVWPIMAKILGVGIEPKPFMYPAFKEGTKDLQKHVNEAIQRYLDKQ